MSHQGWREITVKMKRQIKLTLVAEATASNLEACCKSQHHHHCPQHQDLSPTLGGIASAGQTINMLIETVMFGTLQWLLMISGRTTTVCSQPVGFLLSGASSLNQAGGYCCMLTLFC